MKYLKTFEDLNQDQTDFDELDDFVKQMTIENKKYWISIANRASIDYHDDRQTDRRLMA